MLSPDLLDAASVNCSNVHSPTKAGNKRTHSHLVQVDRTTIPRPTSSPAGQASSTVQPSASSRKRMRLNPLRAVSSLAHTGLDWICYGAAVGLAVVGVIGGYRATPATTSISADQHRRELDPPPYDFRCAKPAPEQMTSVHHHYHHHLYTATPQTSRAEPKQGTRHEAEAEAEDSDASFASLELKIAQMIRQGEEALAAPIRLRPAPKSPVRSQRCSMSGNRRIHSGIRSRRASSRLLSSCSQPSSPLRAAYSGSPDATATTRPFTLPSSVNPSTLLFAENDPIEARDFKPSHVQPSTTSSSLDNRPPWRL